MPQGFKKSKPGKGGKTHMSRKQKPKQKKVQGWKAKADRQLTRTINRNAEDIVIGKAKEGKIRLKLAGQHRIKK